MKVDSRDISYELNDLFLKFSIWIKECFSHVMYEGEAKNFTWPQYKVLKLIKNMQPCKMSEVSTKIKVSHASLTSMIDRLEEEGTVCRTYSKEDRRVVNIELTKMGEDILEVLEDSIIKFIDTKVQAFDESKLAILSRAMLYLNEIFNDISEGEPASPISENHIP